MGIVDKIKRLFNPCKHVMCLVWERDYEKHVLGKQPPPFLPLNGDRTVYVCNKCGYTEEGPFIPTEEHIWVDAHMISHFPEEGA